MSFPGNILDGISRIFDGEIDEIFLYILVFLFFFFTGSRDENISENQAIAGNGIPMVLIIVFLFFTLGKSDGNNLPTQV